MPQDKGHDIRDGPSGSGHASGGGLEHSYRRAAARLGQCLKRGSPRLAGVLAVVGLAGALAVLSAYDAVPSDSVAVSDLFKFLKGMSPETERDGAMPSLASAAALATPAEPEKAR